MTYDYNAQLASPVIERFTDEYFFERVQQQVEDYGKTKRLPMGGAGFSKLTEPELKLINDGIV